MAAPEIAIGRSSFEDIRAEKSFLVDKTLLIKEWWECDEFVTLITRPRRFGKTLNINMMDCFFSTRYAGKGDILFGSAGGRKKLKIWSKPIEGDMDFSIDFNLDERPQPRTYQELQGTFPVISLSFAGMHSATCDGMLVELAKRFRNLYEQFSGTLKQPCFFENLKIFSSCSHDKFSVPPANLEGALTGSLYLLARCLYERGVQTGDGGERVHVPVLIFLDEYNAPVQAACDHGYWEDNLKPVMFDLFEQTFRDCGSEDCIYRSMITGTACVEHGSLFPGTGSVSSVVNPDYDEFFGFTETEVEEALDLYGLQAYRDDVQLQYDGYTFGDCRHMYNPWSVTGFLHDAGKAKAGCPVPAHADADPGRSTVQRPAAESAGVF